jgi:hypothetical protein
MPDWYVPIDTLSFNPVINSMEDRILFIDYANRYRNTNYEKLAKMSLTSFLNDFHFTENDLNEIQAFAKDRGLTNIYLSEDIKERFKAELGRALFGSRGFAAVLFRRDHEFITLKSMENDNYDFFAQN